MSVNALPPPPTAGTTPELRAFLTLVQRTLNEMLKGRGNQLGGPFTLTASAASTVVTDNLFAADMMPAFWIPTTANAALEIANGAMYVSARANGSFTVAHANNIQSDRTFYYIRGG